MYRHKQVNSPQMSKKWDKYHKLLYQLVPHLILFCFWHLIDVGFGSMFINLYESLFKGKTLYTLIFIHFCEAMLTALTAV